MPSTSTEDQEAGLPPPGQRWGTGVQSVLPFLTRSLQAKPAVAPEARELRPCDGNPVFRNWQGLPTR